jgi:hypothetical protein
MQWLSGLRRGKDANFNRAASFVLDDGRRQAAGLQPRHELLGTGTIARRTDPYPV